jgi:hypothetical protein
LAEGEWRRIWRDFWQFVGSGQAGVLMILLGGAGGVAAGYVAQTRKLDPLATGEWALVGVIGVPLLFCFVVFVAVWRGTLKRQRDEARREVVRLTRFADADAQLAEDFGAFVLAARATKPAHLPASGNPFTEAGMLALQTSIRSQEEKMDDWRRRVMAEYHADFRPRITEFLRQPGREKLRADYIKLVNEPSSVDDLEMLSEAFAQPVSPNDEPSAQAQHQTEVLRQAIGRILVELGCAKGAIERTEEDGEWWVEPLSRSSWQQSADLLAGAGFNDAHKAARIAYRQLTELDQRAEETRAAMDAAYDYDPPPGMRPSTGGGLTDEFRTAIHTIDTAEAALENVQARISRDVGVAAIPSSYVADQRESLPRALAEADKEGARVLADAAPLEPAGNLGFRDDVLRRADVWIDGISDTLSKHDEHELLLRWTNDPRWLVPGPQPITRDQIQRFVVVPLGERLELLRDFQREVAQRASLEGASSV